MLLKSITEFAETASCGSFFFFHIILVYSIMKFYSKDVFKTYGPNVARVLSEPLVERRFLEMVLRWFRPNFSVV